MTKKRLTATEAEAIRLAKVENLLNVNVNVKPTKGINSGAHGCAAELLTAEYGSLKTCVSKTWQVDNFVHLVDENGKRYAQPIERKTNGGEITQIINRLENGKNGIVIYSLDVCNSNTRNIRRYVSPRIMWYSSFVELLENAGAIRYGKIATNGQQVIAIEPTKKHLPALLESMTEYDDSREMSILEIR